MTQDTYCGFSTVSCAEKVSVVLCEFFEAVDQLENLSACYTSLTAACSLQLMLLDNQRANNEGVALINSICIALTAGYVCCRF